MNKNIITIIFLVLMLASYVVSIRLYSKVENEKKKTARAYEQLKIQLDSNLLLKKKYDDIARQLSDSLSKDYAGIKKPSFEKTILEDLKSISQSSAKLNNLPAFTQASQLEKEGFDALINNRFDLALSRFSEAEKISPSFHMAYEISRLLRKNKARFHLPEAQQEIKKEIVQKYSWGAPADRLNKLKEQVK